MNQYNGLPGQGASHSSCEDPSQGLTGTSVGIISWRVLFPMAVEGESPVPLHLPAIPWHDVLLLPSKRGPG